MKRWQFEFWARRRPTRSSQSGRRLPEMSTLRKPDNGTVIQELESFHLYGNLRRSTTEVRNTLPTGATIETEKTLLSFESNRKLSPDNVAYDDFYRCLSATVSAPPSRLALSTQPTQVSRLGMSTQQSQVPVSLSRLSTRQGDGPVSRLGVSTRQGDTSVSRSRLLTRQGDALEAQSRVDLSPCLNQNSKLKS